MKYNFLKISWKSNVNILIILARKFRFTNSPFLRKQFLDQKCCSNTVCKAQAFPLKIILDPNMFGIKQIKSCQVKMSLCTIGICLLSSTSFFLTQTRPENAKNKKMGPCHCHNFFPLLFYIFVALEAIVCFPFNKRKL